MKGIFGGKFRNKTELKLALIKAIIEFEKQNNERLLKKLSERYGKTSA